MGFSCVCQKWLCLGALSIFGTISLVWEFIGHSFGGPFRFFGTSLIYCYGYQPLYLLMEILIDLKFIYF